MNNELSRCGRKRCVVVAAYTNRETLRNTSGRTAGVRTEIDIRYLRITRQSACTVGRTAQIASTNEDMYFIPDACLNFVTSSKDHP